MVFRSLNSENMGFNNVPTLSSASSEKISSLYPQTHKIGINVDKNLQRFINYDDDNIDKIRAGSSIPSGDRGRVWQVLSNSDSLHLETLYQQLIHEPTPYKQMIQRDIYRTFPNSDMFSKESGQRAMERVLHAYSLYDDEINYCQGLAFLVGPLLMNMHEQQAFSVFVRLMETHGMRTMFTQNMEGLQLRLYQFDRLLEEFLPDIYQFFEEHGVDSQMYLSPWFLTLFAYILPMDLVMRIYDLVFVQDAAIETMMRVALSLLMRASSYIKSLSDFEDIITFLSSKRMNTDDDSFIKDSLQLCGYVTRTKLEQLQNQYELQKKKPKENAIFKTENKNSTSGIFFEKLRYDNTLSRSNNSINNNKKKTKKIKSWFSTISNKSKVSPPEAIITVTKQQPASESPLDNNTILLHQQIEELVSALSLVQKENISLKNELYEQTTTRSKSNHVLESKINQLSKDLQEMTTDRDIYRRQTEEAKQQVYELSRQLDRHNDFNSCTTPIAGIKKYNICPMRDKKALKRSNSNISDTSSSGSSSCYSMKNDIDVPYLLPSPPLFEKEFCHIIASLDYKSNDMI